MAVIVFVTVMVVVVIVVVREVDIELHAGDAGFLLARNVEVIAVELEFLQLAFQLARVHAEVEQRADEHVAADAAEDVEVKSFHSFDGDVTSAFRLSALIWLAA